MHAQKVQIIGNSNGFVKRLKNYPIYLHSGESILIHIHILSPHTYTFYHSYPAVKLTSYSYFTTSTKQKPK